MNHEKHQTYLLLEFDGTFCFSDGNDKINGKYESKDNTITLTFENGSSGELKIENGIITIPTGERLVKE